jgi:hypothetical protein
MFWHYTRHILETQALDNYKTILNAPDKAFLVLNIYYEFYIMLYNSINC